MDNKELIDELSLLEAELTSERIANCNMDERIQEIEECLQLALRLLKEGGSLQDYYDEIGEIMESQA